MARRPRGRVPEGGEDQRGGGRARVLVPDAARAEVGGPALARLHRHGGRRAVRGRRGGRGQGVGLRRPVLDRLGERPGSRGERVDHRLVSLAGRAELLHARQGRVEGQAECGQVHLLGGAQSLPGPAERHPVQRPGGAADLGDQRGAGQDEHRPRRRGRLGVERGQHGGETAGQVDPVIGVADLRVKLGKVVAVGLDHPGRRGDPRAEGVGVHGV